MKVPLSRIAHARSGDKGDISNIGVIALEQRSFPVLLREMTAERVKRYFGGLVSGNVTRYPMSGLWAINFVMEGALDGGGTMSLRTDAQGKTLAAALLMMEVDVSHAELTD